MTFLTPGASGLGQPWYNRPNTVAGMGGVLSLEELTSVKSTRVPPPGFPASSGAINHVSQMMALPQAGAPSAAAPPGVSHVSQMMSLPQANAVPRGDFVPGEIESARAMVGAGQAFQLAGLGNNALPVSDLLPGELESAHTLVATTSVGNVRARGRGRGRPAPAGTPCSSEYLARRAAQRAYRNCARQNMGHTRTQVAGGVAAGGTNATTRASEGALLGMGNNGNYHGQYGRALPVSDLTKGEFMTGGQIARHPQSFGGMGAHSTLMQSLPQAVPVSDLVKGEFMTGKQITAHRQAFGGLGNGRAVPRRDFVPGELKRPSWITGHRQAFGGLGQAGVACARCGKVNCPCGCAGDWRRCTCRAVPISDLAPGEYTTGRTLVDHAQRFSGNVAGMGDWIPFTKGEPEPKRGQQGTWLSPDQVPAADRESAASLIASPQNFGGLGNVGPGRAVPRRDFVPGEIVSGRSLTRHRQSFGGMADWIPFTKGEPEPTGGTQGTWLSPDQVPAWDRESGAKLASQHQNFGGLGAGRPVPRADFVPGEIRSAASIVAQPQNFGGLGAGRAVPRRDFVPGELKRPSWITGHRQAFGGLGSHATLMKQLPQSNVLPISDLTSGEFQRPQWITDHAQAFGGMGATGDNVKVGKLDLSPICDPVSGECISYATPQEIRSAIGQKIGGQSALHQSKVQLPAFYSHPELGPWGVDPRAAYQYWWAQQAAMQRAAVGGPLSIWGSPGSVAPTPPLQASPIAQTASFDPYNDNYPSAGAAVERF
jgi:hypothetical protein